jgi:hypothetical protein
MISVIKMAHQFVAKTDQSFRDPAVVHQISRQDKARYAQKRKRIQTGKKPLGKHDQRHFRAHKINQRRNPETEGHGHANGQAKQKAQK